MGNSFGKFGEFVPGYVVYEPARKLVKEKLLEISMREEAQSSTTSWARHALASDSGNLLDAIKRGFPVRLIATFEPNLKTCNSDAALREVLEDREMGAFDHIPVHENSRTIGLLQRDSAVEEACETVRDAMAPLDETNLISAEDSVLSFIETADKSPCRLVLDGRQIRGIVTLSDLQQLPVRPLIFLLVNFVELLLADLIRSLEIPEETWLASLNDDRRSEVENKWQRLNCSNMAIDKLTATEFADKKRIVHQQDGLPWNGKQFKKDMEKVQWLRDAVVHAGEYAATKENALKTVATVRICQHWIDTLRSYEPDK